MARGDILSEEMFQEEICFSTRYAAGGDMLPKEICCCKNMLPEEYVTEGDMLPEKIYFRRRYVSGGDMLSRGDMLLKEICCWRRYVA